MISHIVYHTIQQKNQFFYLSLENILGSPVPFKLACKKINPRETHHVLFETAIICATVGIMCPAMSFIAAFLYYNYSADFNMWTLLAEWLKLVCYNFPFVFLHSFSLFSLLQEPFSRFSLRRISRQEILYIIKWKKKL